MTAESEISEVKQPRTVPTNILTVTQQTSKQTSRVYDAYHCTNVQSV